MEVGESGAAKELSNNLSKLYGSKALKMLQKMSSKQNTRDEKIAQFSQNQDETKIGHKRTNVEAK